MLFHVKQSASKSTWVNPRNLPAAESERVLGKSIEHEYNLFELLRRPDVSYEDPDVLDGGLYASGDVSRETLGDAERPVVEQVEIAAKYSGYIDRQKDEVERAAHYEKAPAARPGLYAGDGAVDRGAPGAGSRTGRKRWAMAARISGITPGSDVVVAGAPEEGWSKDKGPERLNRRIRV
jgi:tRNA uridine 5-carboxymethylaminomethyl modification enzyme